MGNTRATIISAIKTRMQSILTTGGYQTNLGSHVYVWRTVPIVQDETPALVIRDTIDEVIDLTEGSGYSMPSQHQLRVELEVVVSDTTATIGTVRDCYEDVMQAIGTDETWSNNALRTVELSNEMVTDQERDTIGGIIINLRVDYRTQTKWTT